MKQNIHSLTILLIIMVLHSSCDRPECRTTDSLIRHLPGSREYNRTLAAILANNSITDLTFWQQSYFIDSTGEYIAVHVQDTKNVCGVMKLKVINHGNLKGLCEKEGRSYRGAQLYGLTFHTEYNNGFPEFVLDKVDCIID